MQFAQIDKQQIFKMGMGGYYTFRIPVIIRAANGDILAFAEARMDSDLDYGRIDIVMRRSRDNGCTWEEMCVIATDGENTLGNQCPIVDRDTGNICMVFCTNPALDGEMDIIAGGAERRIYQMMSRDNGETWSQPVDICAQAHRPGWTWLASGPCHGLQLESGRYIIPCNHAELAHEPQSETRSHILYSDDRGATWNIGAELPWGTNECCAAEKNGVLYLSMRTRLFGTYRTSAESRDGGLNFSGFQADYDLPDPWCEGAVLPYEDGLLFSNAASERRERLTLRFRKNESRWEEGLVLEPGHAAYSDLAIADSGEILVLYETGQESPYEEIWLARVVREEQA